MNAPTLDRHLDAYLAQRLKLGHITRHSAGQYRHSLGAFVTSFGHRPLDQLGPRAVERFLEQIADRSPATRRTYLSRIRRFCGWMVQRRVIDRDPTVDIECIRQPRLVPRAMRTGEVARILAAAPDARARAIVWLMVGCGLRCSEVAGLGMGDFDQGERNLFVRGKGGHERVVPVPDTVAAAIGAYTAEVGIAAGPMIRSRSRPSRGLTGLYVSNVVVAIVRDAGLKGARYDGRSGHALRHTAASDVLDQCGDIRVVQAMLGHARLDTTERYVRRVDLAAMRAAMEGRPYLPEAA